MLTFTLTVFHNAALSSVADLGNSRFYAQHLLPVVHRHSYGLPIIYDCWTIEPLDFRDYQIPFFRPQMTSFATADFT